MNPSLAKTKRRNAAMMAMALFCQIGELGCVIPTPIAVYPTQCKGNGALVEVQDSVGTVDREGLLIVHRRKRGLLSKPIDEFDDLVTLRGGQANVPERWTVGSAWIVPNIMTFCIPAVVDLPQEEVILVPLISGCYLRSSEWQRKQPEWWEELRLKSYQRAVVHVESDSSQEDYRRQYLEEILRNCRREWEPMDSEKRLQWLDFHLRKADYERVKAFIESELKTLAKPATSRPTSAPSKEEVEAEADAIFDRAMRVYRSLKSYEDVVEIRIENVGGGTPDSAQVVRFAYVRPNQISLASEESRFCSDGHYQWSYDARERTYQKRIAPEKIDLGSLFEKPGGFMFLHPVAWIISSSKKDIRKVLPTPFIRKIISVRSASEDAHAFKVVRMVAPFPVHGGAWGEWELWFWCDSGLLKKITIELDEKMLASARPRSGDEDSDVPSDAAKTLSKQEGGESPENIIWHVDFRDVRLNGEIPKERFQFRPEPKDKGS